ncbi:MAG: hypothetical protein HRT82_15480 [Henriciella sp.]|nr:hypothetical protein [Henriciella sp.]
MKDFRLINVGAAGLIIGLITVAIGYVMYAEAADAMMLYSENRYLSDLTLDAAASIRMAILVTWVGGCVTAMGWLAILAGCIVSAIWESSLDQPSDTSSSE